MSPKSVLGAITILVSCGCIERTGINVDCVGEKDGLRCTVEHLQGSDTVKACWEVVMSCRNGTEARGGACQIVEPGKKAITRIPSKQIRGADQCDVISKSSVENRTVAPAD